MKILIIASGVGGGARLSALTLAKAIAMTTSHQVYITSKDNENLDNLNFTNLSKNGLYNFLSKVATLIQKIVTKPKFGIVSVYSIGRIDKKKIRNLKPDIIHIHNWFNLLNPKDFLRLSEIAPLVFTTHDQRLITGGCHITYECESYKDHCSNCIAIHLIQKSVSKNYIKFEEIFPKLGNYGVITPTLWTYKKIAGSSLVKNSAVFENIPNLIKVPSKSEIANRGLHSSMDKNEEITLRFIASNINEHAKGLDLLISALDHYYLSSGKKINLNIYGFGKPKYIRDYNIIYHGFQNNESQNWSNPNIITIVPSRMDNAPSTILEAQLNHSFVIGTITGGIPDLIKDGVTGILSEVDAPSLAKAISRYQKLENGTRNQILRTAYEDASKRINEKHVLEKHLNVYKELLKS